MWEELGEYIIKNYKPPLKIIEIGIGKYYDISNYLEKEKEIKLLKVDINPSNETIIKDDIKQPKLEIYENANIIYSIRPPYELQPYLMKLQEQTKATLIIKPLTNETLHHECEKMKLKTYKKLSFYIHPEKIKKENL